MLKLLLGLSPSTLAIGGLLLGAAPAGYAGYKVGHWSGFRAGSKAGSEAMAGAVEKQNIKTGEAARAVKRTVDDCIDLGGEWNQTEGKCDR